MHAVVLNVEAALRRNGKKNLKQLRKRFNFFQFYLVSGLYHSKQLELLEQRATTSAGKLVSILRDIAKKMSPFLDRAAVYIFGILCPTFLCIFFYILVVFISLLIFVINTFLVSPLYKFSSLRSFICYQFQVMHGLDVRNEILLPFLSLLPSCLYVYFKLARCFSE